jgi:hypothetical protein
MGFNRNMPLGAVFGLRYLHVEQGCQKTSALLQHIRQHSRIGKMIWTVKQWSQVTAGVSFAAYAEPWRFLPNGVSQWFSSLRDFLADSQCTIEIASSHIGSTWQVHTYSQHPAGPRPFPRGGRRGDFTDGEMRAITAAGCSFRSNFCQMLAQLTA